MLVQQNGKNGSCQIKSLKSKKSPLQKLKTPCHWLWKAINLSFLGSIEARISLWSDFRLHGSEASTKMWRLISIELKMGLGKYV